jgi:hypothetical protein
MQVQAKLKETLNFSVMKKCSFATLVVFFALPLSSPGAQAGCFDFSAQITEPKHILVTTDQSGNLAENLFWAAVRGDVSQPIQVLLKDLEDHRSTRSSRIDKMEIKDLKDPNYLIKQEVHSEVDPFPFVKVEWTEIWGFAVTQGTPDHPERVVISYEKTEGTSHIEHLCGSYVLQKKGDGNTDVFIYEEAKATGRSEKDTLQGLQGNLAAFRKLAPGTGRNAKGP